MIILNAQKMLWLLKIKGFVVFCLLTLLGSVQAKDLERIAALGLGFATATVFHELGHAAFAKSMGLQIQEIGFQSIQVKAKKKDSLAALKYKYTALGGYVAQSLATEILFQSKAWRSSDYVFAWMSLGIFINISNPIRYYLLGQKNNDLGIFESYGGNPELPALLMLSYAFYTISRIVSNQNRSSLAGDNAFALGFSF